MNKVALLIGLTCSLALGNAYAHDTISAKPTTEKGHCETHKHDKKAGEPCDHKNCDTHKHMHDKTGAAANMEKPKMEMPDTPASMDKHAAKHSGMMGMMGGGKAYNPDMFMESPITNIAQAMELSPEQDGKVHKIADDLRRTNWALYGNMLDEGSKLRGLYKADKRDATEIGKQYQKIFDFQRQMIENLVGAENQINETLTETQRTRMKDMMKKMGPMMH